MTFDSDSTHMHMDSCVTEELTGFKSDFIEVSYAEVLERSSGTATDESIVIGDDIAACTLKEDNGELSNL